MQRGRAVRVAAELARLPNVGLDRVGLFREASRLIRRVVAFDGASWHSHDPATMLMTGAYKHDLTSENFPLFAENENAQADVNKFRDLGRNAPRAETLLRATGGRPHRSQRYREIFRDMGIEHELRATFRVGAACWGSVALVRSRGRDDFDEDELSFIAGVAPSIARALRLAILLPSHVDRAAAEEPGMVLIDAKRGVETMTPVAARWLEDLAEPDGFPLCARALPVAVADVVAAARSGISGAARAITRTRSGRWLLLHASLTQDDPDRVAVILEPAPVSAVVPLLVGAYGLSVREREVTELVLRGFSTAEIAAALFITPYTVKDHLKSVFEKTRSGSRGELASRLFWHGCAPRMDTAVL